ncbi:MAG: exostosin family protein [Rubricoccaceae bacterium]|nr:exostosin family protein [Rubricoccaceae bacterium]
MARVHLLSAYDPDVALLGHLEASAQQSDRGRHALTDDPEDADVVLFVEARPGWPFYERVVRHPLARRHRSKCFLFTRVDNPAVVMQGIYASVPRRAYDPQWVRSGLYLSATRWQPAAPLPSDPLLFSFLGNVTNHPIRERLLAMNGADAVVEDTSALWPYDALPPEERARAETRYDEIGRRSRFILAPRGKGASSIRLFEALRMGRPPVIVSDEWVPPEGPDWDAISVRVPERDVGAIPALLRARAPEAEAMGRRAREAWEAWFSERTVFDTLVAWCLAIRAERRLPEALLRRSVYVRSFRFMHAKAMARRLLDALPARPASHPEPAGSPAPTPRP